MIDLLFYQPYFNTHCLTGQHLLENLYLGRCVWFLKQVFPSLIKVQKTSFAGNTHFSQWTLQLSHSETNSTTIHVS